MFRSTSLVVLFMVVFFNADGHFLSRFWPQDKLAANELGSKSAPVRVLIAGKEVPFCDTVINHLVNKFDGGAYYFRILDLKDLSREQSNEWDAILLMNSCIGWDYDNLVKRYIKRNSNYPHFVVFTTSDNPNGCQVSKWRKYNWDIDAYTCASFEDHIGESVDTLYELLKKHLTGE